MTEIREWKSSEPVIQIPDDRGYSAKVWYLKDTVTSKGDAVVEIYLRGEILRRFIFPAYKIWNIPAHFTDIVDGEIEGDDRGYRMAAWNGIGPV